MESRTIPRGRLQEGSGDVEKDPDDRWVRVCCGPGCKMRGLGMFKGTSHLMHVRKAVGSCLLFQSKHV